MFICSFRGYIYPGTEGFIFALRDKIILTKIYEWHMLGLKVSEVCRKCNKSGVTVKHLTEGCEALAAIAYLGRHNQVAEIIHRQLALNSGLK